MRLLICAESKGQATVEVAHEALLREWPLLADWIDQQREAFLRRDEVRRSARRWDENGRPDHLLPNPVLVKENRDRLEQAGLWNDLHLDDAVAWFLAKDSVEELIDLTEREFRHRTEAAGAMQPALRLLLGLTTPDRHTWETIEALGHWVLEQDPPLAVWLREGLELVLRLLEKDDARDWHCRRVKIGDLMSLLGDSRKGVGLREDGLPDIDWAAIPGGDFIWQSNEHRTLPAFRIARYPVTSAQYSAFTEDPDYDNPDWWKEGISAPLPAKPRWSQANRPRNEVAWVEALAFCRWLTARYREAGLIGPQDGIRLPTEYQWERAARSTDGREYPWGPEYRIGYANIDETYDRTGPHFLRETTAVGLYPQGASADGLLDCAGNVWEWCLNKYANPDDTDTAGSDQRSLRGGSWGGNRDGASAAFRYDSNPNLRNTGFGFRVVCVSPIDY
ncbi:MAG: formylglycine-generating enzyme family protein [Pseudomonadota bacterium]|nr:formylglycine-generating enzyme family protein [Pseudomonadota bacterium]